MFSDGILKFAISKETSWSHSVRTCLPRVHKLTHLSKLFTLPATTTALNLHTNSDSKHLLHRDSDSINKYPSYRHLHSRCLPRITLLPSNLSSTPSRALLNPLLLLSLATRQTRLEDIHFSITSGNLFRPFPELEDQYIKQSLHSNITINFHYSLSMNKPH